MDPQSVGQVIELLKSVRQHKLMYITTLDVEATYNFLSGFRTALSVLGYEYALDVFAQVYRVRGWDYTAKSYDMRASGLDDEAIMDELLDIEIDAWMMVKDGLVPDTASSRAEDGADLDTLSG